MPGGSGPSPARLSIHCAIPYEERKPVDSSTEYYAYRIRVLPGTPEDRTLCPGCETPVRLVLENIQLFQAPELSNDPVLTEPGSGNTVFWQATAGAIPSIGGIAPMSGAAGTEVTIAGHGFSSASAVRFSQTP